MAVEAAMTASPPQRLPPDELGDDLGEGEARTDAVDSNALGRPGLAQRSNEGSPAALVAA